METQKIPNSQVNLDKEQIWKYPATGFNYTTKLQQSKELGTDTKGNTEINGSEERPEIN